MLKHILPFITYLLIPFVIKDTFLSYFLKILIVGGMLIYFWKNYKIKWKTNYAFPIFAGITIFAIWVGLDGVYPIIGQSIATIPENMLDIILKLTGMVLIAPVIEELFVRNYLHRAIIHKDHEKVKHGTFTWPAFILTTLFFAVAHKMWLAGLITGITLNLVYYRHKNIGSCIITHGIANLLLAIYVLTTSNWFLW